MYHSRFVKNTIHNAPEKIYSNQKMYHIFTILWIYQRKVFNFKRSSITILIEKVNCWVIFAPAFFNRTYLKYHCFKRFLSITCLTSPFIMTIHGWYYQAIYTYCIVTYLQLHCGRLCFTLKKMKVRMIYIPIYLSNLSKLRCFLKFFPPDVLRFNRNQSLVRLELSNIILS